MEKKTNKYSGSDRQQTTKQWPWPFFGASLALGDPLELLLCPITELVLAGCHIKIHFSLHVLIWSRNDSLLLHRIIEYNTSKLIFFFDQLMRHSLIELCYLSNLLQISYDHRMISFELFATSGVAVTGSASMLYQERILELVAISFSRGSSWSRDQPAAPALAGGFLTTEPSGKSNYIVCRKSS